MGEFAVVCKDSWIVLGYVSGSFDPKLAQAEAEKQFPGRNITVTYVPPF